MAKEEVVTFTPREMEVLALAWQCFESEPKIDIKKLARLTGYTEGSAGVTIGKIKRKLKDHAASNGDGDDGTSPAATPKKTPAKTPKSKSKSTGKRTVSTASSVKNTPAKKRKTPAGGASEPNVFQEEEEDEEEEFKLKTEVDDEVGDVGFDGSYRY